MSSYQSNVVCLLPAFSTFFQFCTSLQEFANFVDDLGMNLSFSATHDFYNELSAPSEGMLLLNNFYKNLQGDSCTLTELHRRLEEVGWVLTGCSVVAPVCTQCFLCSRVTYSKLHKLSCPRSVSKLC